MEEEDVQKENVPVLLVGDNFSEDQWLKDRAAEVTGHQLPG